jgi:RNA polymerase sigma-70 factor (ECF subfamily)
MGVAAPAYREIPDEEIVRRFQMTGDTGCFAELFNRHRRRVYCSCRGFFCDGSAAEDATQETFLRAFQSIHSFLGGNFGGWLMRIAKNVCIDLWRKRRPECGPEEIDFDAMTAPRNIDQTSDMHLAVDKLRAEMATLPPEQRREMKRKWHQYQEERDRESRTAPTPAPPTAPNTAPQPAR